MAKTAATKAYSVLELDEWTGGIVFAPDKRTARRQGASCWADGEADHVEVRRMQSLDRYHLTGVPAAVLVEEGWHFECHGCDRRIEQCSLEDDGMKLSGIVGFENGPIYCCHACRMESKAEDAAREAFGQAFLDMLKDMVRARFPGIEHAFGEHRQHFYISRHRTPMVIVQARASFSFPGMKIGPASLDYHHAGQHGRDIIGPVRPEFHCCNGDREAFEALAAETREDA